MRKVKVASTIIVTILIAGMLALSTYGKGKPPKPEPVLDYVVIEGDIWGGGVTDGDPVSISITFSDTFMGIDEDELPHDESGAHVANPDNPPALKVGGAGINRRLSYYYCTADSHSENELDGCGRCDPTASGHDPEYYRQLVIFDGKYDRKTGQTVFPKGSRWQINGKVILLDGTWDGWLVAEGTLIKNVDYKEFYQ